MGHVCRSIGFARMLLGLAVPLSLQAQPLTRTAATTLTLPAQAPQSGFRTERIFGNLEFDQPLAIVTPPGETNRLFIVEKTGRIRVIPDQANPTAEVFLDLRDRVGATPGETGLLALAFHPDYADNGTFYVWYTTRAATDAGTGRHDRLARFQVSADDPNRADPASEQPLITQFDQAGNHNGGELKFGPDGYLYLSLGDEGGANDQFNNSQRIDRDFFSGIIRIDVDRRPGSLPPNPHPAVHAGTYAVPPGNPFVGATSFNGAPVDPEAVRTEFWAVGLRNPWRMAFDPSTGQLWTGDVGQGRREEINLITRGGNYGWAFFEGTLAGPRGSPPSGITFVEPVFEYTNPGQASVTGGIVYRDVQLSQLFGDYLFADYLTGDISALRLQNGEPRVRVLTNDRGIVAFAVNPRDGHILLADLDESAIKRLVYDGAPTGTALPERLSETGAFASLALLTSQPGVVPYEPNVSFWSDHARKTRWFALPDDTGTFGFDPRRAWTLPTGAVWVKHFDLELTRGDPTTARRIETRFIVKTAEGIYGVTYRWNNEQTDATLVPEGGATQEFTIVENGTERTQTWRFPSRSECLACHTPQAGSVLSFNTRQLNREYPYPGGTENQLIALAQAGYLEPDPPAPEGLPALVDSENEAQPLERRVRSYLDVNCSQCHRPDGPGLGTWDARASTPLSFAGIIDGRLTNDEGDPANRLVVPGDVAHSRLYHRIAGSDGSARMPPIATRERNAAGEALVLEWITDLAEPRPPSRLANLSGRALVGTGANILIPGFVIEGSSPRRVLIRAIGPGLTSFGVPDTLPEPTLRLFAGPSPLGANQGWNNAANADEIRTVSATLGAFALAEGSADSAMLVTLNPGLYTAHVADAAGRTGIALFEVYDAESGANVRLTNTSVRAQVGGGAGVIIPGLVVSPGEFKTVLIRAVGPGLAGLGVANHLREPVLTLFAGPEAFERNAGWSEAENAAEIASAAAAVGAFPLQPDSADSAILTTLSPGAYTLHVSSADGTTGVALVEVYAVE